MSSNPLAPYHLWLVIIGAMLVWQSNFDVVAVIVCSGMAWLFWKFDQLFRPPAQ